MNDAQRLVVARDQFALKRQSDEALRLILPSYEQARDNILRQLQNLPPGAVERELWLRQQLVNIEGQFRAVGNRIYDVLPAEQVKAWEEALDNAAEYLKAGGVEPVGQTVTFAGETAGGQAVSQSVNLPTLSTDYIRPSITQQQIVAAARREGFATLSPGGATRSLDDVLPGFLRSEVQNVERKLRTGFLLGQSTDEIIRDLDRDRLGRSQVEAVVRTSMAESSQAAHNAFFDANEDLLPKTKSGYRWEWDASNDTRLCEICAPLDGARYKTREEAPSIPAHFNCRCRLLPITATAELLREEGDEPDGSFLERKEVTYVKDAKNRPVTYTRQGKVYKRYERTPPEGWSGPGAYKRPQEIDGKMYWVRRRDLPKGQTLAGDMLKRMDDENKLGILGTKKRVAEWNSKIGLAKYKDNPQQLVRDMLRPDGGAGAPPMKLGRGPKPKPSAPTKVTVKPKPKAAPKPKALEAMSNAEVVKELEEKYDLPIPPGLRGERQMLLQELAERRGLPQTPAAAIKQADDILDEFKDVAPKKPRKVGDQGAYSKLQKEFDAAEEKLGKGNSGEVVLTKDGKVIKWGQIGEFEADAMRKLDGTGISPKLFDAEDLEIGFKAGAGADADKTSYFVGRYDGLLKMSKAKGKPLVEWNLQTGFSREADVRSAFLQASKKMHLKGVAHNDRHDLNFFVAEKKGKLSGSFVDYGLAQTDPRAALIEAMGNSNYKRDFQVEMIGTVVERETDPSWIRYQSNLSKVEDELRTTSGGSQLLRKTVRTSSETLDKLISEEEAWDLLKLLYEGV